MASRGSRVRDVLRSRKRSRRGKTYGPVGPSLVLSPDLAGLVLRTCPDCGVRFANTVGGDRCFSCSVMALTVRPN